MYCLAHMSAGSKGLRLAFDYTIKIFVGRFT